MKYKLFLLIIIILIIFYIVIPNYDINYINNFIIPKYLNLRYKDKIKNKIKIAVYTGTIYGGGRAKITSILINYLIKIKLFDVYLFTKENKHKNEYKISNNAKRIIINNNLFKIIEKIKISILIYELTKESEIKKLNKLDSIKVIYYHHSSVLGYIYNNYSGFKKIYKVFKESKYFITLVPFENDYLFKKWGIKSILMNNFMTYDFNSVIPSDLSSKIILMIGRANQKNKRFEMGIKAMKYIIKEIPDSELKIISKLIGIYYLKKLVNDLNLRRNIKFEGFTTNPEIYLKNASLHFFPTLFESFGLVLSEAKLYGIPTILMGLNYISLSKGGTVIIYDDNPLSLAKEAIKILKNKIYRKKLGKEARNSIKYYNNQNLLIKWVKLILSIYKGESHYEILRKQDKEISQKESLEILKIQVKLLKMRIPRFFNNITTKLFENLTYMENLNIK